MATTTHPSKLFFIKCHHLLRRIDGSKIHTVRLTGALQKTIHNHQQSQRINSQQSLIQSQINILRPRNRNTLTKTLKRIGSLKSNLRRQRKQQTIPNQSRRTQNRLYSTL